jgi:hypothetical protein
MILDYSLSYSTRPATTTEVELARVQAILEDSLAVAAEVSGGVALTSDSAFDVPFDTLPDGATVLIVRATTAITIAMTSAAGTLQALPVRDLFFLVSPTPITALRFTRTAGIASQVSFYLGSP